MYSECVICLTESNFIIEYECKHTVCITCGLRLLKLYQNRDCPLCKQTSSICQVKDFSSIIIDENKDNDIIYQNKECKEKVTSLLLNKCKKCNKTFRDSYELKFHYREVHALLLCYECCDNKKQFWFEHELYTVSTLRHHKNGKLNEDGFKGHVFCVFCNYFLYDEVNAKQHCNQTHVLCTICDILGMKNRYYKNFVDLESHFKNAHYCCTFNYCVGIKAYVFPYKTELLEHLLKFHKQTTKFNDIASNNSCNITYFDPYYLFTQNSIKTHVLNNSMVNLNMSNTETNKQENDIPFYLDRSKISEINRNKSLRKSLIKRLVTKNQNEAIEIVEKMVSKRLSIKDGCADLKLLMTENELLKLLKDLHFEDVQNEMNDYYKILEKQILFPKFNKLTVETKSNTKKQETVVGFKILDLKNYKKK